MKKYTTEIGIVAPLDRANVDTDLIIPKQFLKSIKRTGFGDNLFDELRYLDEGYLGQDISKRPKNPDFVLNQERYQNATILLTRANFGCGSSREHAPWALNEFGFRTVIAPSFADIFFNNCFKNGMLPVILSENDIDDLFKECFDNVGYTLKIDLENQKVISPNGKEYGFEIDSFRKHCLLNGLDDIGLTLQNADDIKAFEEKAKKERPWVFRELVNDVDCSDIVLDGKQAIQSYLFNGLANLNTGFDAPSIIYVSESDFEIVLNRAEQKNINIWGIEPWLDGLFYGVEIFEDYNLSANDPKWYRSAFDKFKNKNRNLQYAITFG